MCIRDRGEEGVAALTEKFKTLVELNISEMEVEVWGKRKLASAINYITEGYYVLISFTSAPEFPKELDLSLIHICIQPPTVTHFFRGLGGRET